MHLFSLAVQSQFSDYCVYRLKWQAPTVTLISPCEEPGLAE